MHGSDYTVAESSLGMASEPLIARSVTTSLDRLAQIGGGERPGVTRLAWSPELLEAYEVVAGWMGDLGLETEVDAAGNLLGRWQVGRGPAVLVGSHLDTVPRGGRLDGVLGVVAALHAVALLQDAGYEPDRPVWVAAFMDEEGTRFGTPLFGSRAFVGEDLSALGARTDATGMTLRDAMAAWGFDLDRVGEACRIGHVGQFLELHIEQGPVLEAEALELGVVTSIVGLLGYRVRLHGEANHAGTTPMSLRRDALAGAARVVLALRDEARRSEGTTANVGRLTVEPGGANVVPGRVELTVDVRAATAERLAELDRFVASAVSCAAAKEGLRAEVEQTSSLAPLDLDPELVDAIERAAVAEGAATRRLASGAGHDAMVIGRYAPAGMLFAPSTGGISHSPAEETRPEHLDLAVRVLAAVLRDLSAAR